MVSIYNLATGAIFKLAYLVCCTLSNLATGAIFKPAYHVCCTLSNNHFIAMPCRLSSTPYREERRSSVRSGTRYIQEVDVQSSARRQVHEVSDSSKMQVKHMNYFSKHENNLVS
jgi:hypothetical protein